MRYLVLVCLIAVVGVAQTQPQPDEIQYIRFILLNIASLDHDSHSTKVFEDGIVKLFGLSPQESNSIHSLAQQLKPLLAQNRKTAQDIIANKGTLSQTDIDALRDLDVQREQRISDLANQILNAVSPATANRLRGAGKNVGNGLKKN